MQEHFSAGTSDAEPTALPIASPSAESLVHEAQISGERASREQTAYEQDPPELDAQRLESLLASRARERRELSRELSRRTLLLQDAIARFSASPTPSEQPSTRVAELSIESQLHLTAQRDAAVARALEAEASRAETSFRLDEALGHLRAALESAEDASALQGTVRGLKVRLIEAEEARSMAEDRLMLAEHDVEDAHTRIKQTQREHAEAGEQLELELVRARDAAAMLADEQARSLVAAVNAARDGALLEISILRGTRDGLVARVNEGDEAFANTRARVLRAEHGLRDALDKLVGVRAELAECQIDTRTTKRRVEEIEQLTRDQLAELQAMRSELAAEREAHAGGAEQGSQRTARLRRALAEARAPLGDLASAIHGALLGSSPTSASGARAPAPRQEATLPGVEITLDAADVPDDKARASEARIQELEAMLAGRSSRDAGMSTLKGELVDVRASATRLSDDLAKERTRRRKLGATVRALQAASESGESVGPWVEELLELLAEGATVPPPR